ncbi:MAG: FHA domain-containing protein [Propionivibrio sp.]
MKTTRVEYHLHLVIERTGDLAADVDDARAGHPVERRLKRLERVVESFRGNMKARSSRGIRAIFDTAEDAVLGACEMQHRCASLPQAPKHRLVVRIGIHPGFVYQRSDDIADNAGDIAALLATVDDGILISQAMADGLKSDLRKLTRRLDEQTLAVAVVQVDWRSEVPTTGFSGESFWPTGPGDGAQPVAPYVVLRHGRKTVQASEDHPVLTVGRDAACDLVLTDTHVSRLHCSIERKVDGIVLTDSSTNGTCIAPDSGDDRVVKNGSVMLRGKGLLFLGRPYKGERRGGVRFEVF